MADDTDDGAVPSRAPQTNGSGDLSPHTGDAADTDSLTPAAGRLRAYLRPEESLRTVARATLVENPQGPAVLGVTDDRFLAVTDAGSVLTVGFDRVRSVRCHTATLPTVHGADARLTVAVGFSAALLGFLGVLATATSPLTPPLAALAAIGAMGATDARYGGVAVDTESAASGVATSISRAVQRRFADGRPDLDGAREWLRAHVDGTGLPPGVGAGAVALSLVLAVVVEGVLLAPLFAIVAASGVALVVFGFHHGRTFDRLGVDWRRERTVTAALDDGTTLTVRTDTDADVDRRIAAHVGQRGRPASPGADRGGPTRSGGESGPSTWSGDTDGS